MNHNDTSRHFIAAWITESCFPGSMRGEFCGLLVALARLYMAAAAWPAVFLPCLLSRMPCPETEKSSETAVLTPLHHRNPSPAWTSLEPTLKLVGCHFGILRRMGGPYGGNLMLLGPSHSPALTRKRPIPEIPKKLSPTPRH